MKLFFCFCATLGIGIELAFAESKEFVYIAKPGSPRQLLDYGTVKEFTFSKKSNVQAIWALERLKHPFVEEYLYTQRVFLIGVFDDETDELILEDWYLVLPSVGMKPKGLDERAFGTADVDWLKDLTGNKAAARRPANYDFSKHFKKLVPVAASKVTNK